YGQGLGITSGNGLRLPSSSVDDTEAESGAAGIVAAGDWLGVGLASSKAETLSPFGSCEAWRCPAAGLLSKIKIITAITKRIIHM
ncbi:MAG TPA: hypothetical protein VI336_03455, partial [Candidatus Saccharimonadales bacterium]|nr:hypothetical protein [Candidatus Saccharimonadales bacterium]